MNPHGHEDVAKKAGLPLLENAFGKDKRSLNAFYLGNWLTDVSQLVDPGAYTKVSGKAKGYLEKIVNEFKNTIDRLIEEITAAIVDWDITEALPHEWKIDSCRSYLEKYAGKEIDLAVKTLHDAIDFLLASRTDERSSRFAAFTRSAFLLIGYFKFVHPTSGYGKERMDFECFMRIFGRPNDTRGAMADDPAMDRPGAYTQSYPHEHLDRPEILPPTDPPIYAPGRQDHGAPFRLAPGTFPGTRSPRRREYITPDLYSYLRDDIEMTAGLLAEVDLVFEQAIKKGVRDDNPEWNITLAKLGHALHQVEDFFSHSNWIELAHKRLGPRFLDKAIPPELPIDLLNKANTIYQKRLKTHLTVPFEDWREHDKEDWVVTGFFDFRDTLISVAHFCEELFGWDVPDPYMAIHDLTEAAEHVIEHPKTVLYEVQKAIDQTLEFITDPERALEDRENEIAQSLREKFEQDIVRLRRPGVKPEVAEQIAREVAEQVASDRKVLRNLPKEIRDAFFFVIVEGSRTYTIGKLSFAIYRSLRQIGQFIRSPVGWLKDQLPKFVTEKIMDALKFYNKERFYEALGANRIGCHSLLAKDYGKEPFYELQKDCAIAVHWYIVSTLFRWSNGEGAYDIDWLELLEYFLRNPLPSDRLSYREVSVVTPGTIVHKVVRGEQLAAKDPQYSLEYKYARMAVGPSGKPVLFTWRTIADANLATYGLPEERAQRVINAILKEKEWGPMKPSNYAFKPGLVILIPSQNAKFVYRFPTQEDPPWFEKVIERRSIYRQKGWQVFTGYEDPETDMSVAPLQHHKPIRISRAHINQMVTRGKTLRRQARQAYRPPDR